MAYIIVNGLSHGRPHTLPLSPTFKKWVDSGVKTQKSYIFFVQMRLAQNFTTFVYQKTGRKCIPSLQICTWDIFYVILVDRIHENRGWHTFIEPVTDMENSRSMCALFRKHLVTISNGRQFLFGSLV